MFDFENHFLELVTSLSLYIFALCLIPKQVSLTNHRTFDRVKVDQVNAGNVAFPLSITFSRY